MLEDMAKKKKEKMVRAELDEFVYENQRYALNRGRITRAEAAMFARLVLEGLASALEDGRDIELRGFGSFAINERPAGSAFNPETRKFRDYPGRKYIFFRPALNIQEALKDKPPGE
jgi:integration host factor subunit beta